MKIAKQKKLRAAGFKIGSVQDFLGISDEELSLIDLKVHLVSMLRTVRESQGVTQKDLARRMGSSQSRIAKLEGSCADASLDLICRALFAIGVSRRELGKEIASRHAA